MDIIAHHLKPTRIWGQILNCNWVPIPNALVRLTKVVCIDNTTCYKELAQTCSDCNGYYEFNIYDEERACYKILVGKSTTGNEVIVTDYNQPTPCENSYSNTVPV